MPTVMTQSVSSLYECQLLCHQCYVWGKLFIHFYVNFPAFSISSENSQVVMIAISAAVAIILLTVVVYVLIGRLVYRLVCTFTPTSVSLRGLDGHGKLGVIGQ